MSGGRRAAGRPTGRPSAEEPSERLPGRRSGSRARRSTEAGRRWGWIAGVAAVVLVGGGIATGAAVAAQRNGDVPAAGASAASTRTPGAASASPTSDPGQAAAGRFQDPSPSSAARSDATPVSVVIPAIGVDASLEDLHRGTGGELDPPESFDDAGWFSEGVVPGQVGPAVIAGHVDSITSAAVFFRLDELVAGDEIHVRMSDGSTVTFSVTGSEQAAKDAFPTSDVYGPSPTPQLRLITCDGTFDTATGHYRDNLIVFASLTSN